jgi:natural product precursor
MKKLNLTLGSLKTMLTKEQMKSVVGGSGTCACQGPDGSVQDDLSKAEAMDCSEEWGTHWCCDSCSSATWY